MKHIILILAIAGVLLTGCAAPQTEEQNAAPSVSDISNVTLNNTAVVSSGMDVNALPDKLMEAYYLSTDHPVKAYLQNNSIQKFFNMWFKEYMCEDIKAHWNYDSLAQVQYLDHKFNSTARSGEIFYTCTFSTDDDRHGYIIVLYGEGEEGPYISKMSLVETTPYLYDMRPNSKQIAAALAETDIDLSTASAARVEWIDTEKNRGDRIILFTDGKNDKYLCYLGTDDFVIEKQ